MLFTMKLSSLLLGLSLFGQTVLSHPLDLPFRLSEDEMHTLEKRQSAIVATTGSAGSTQPRLEIRQMQSQQPNQFTLLILALQRFQAQAQTSKHVQKKLLASPDKIAFLYQVQLLTIKSLEFTVCPDRTTTM